MKKAVIIALSFGAGVIFGITLGTRSWNNIVQKIKERIGCSEKEFQDDLEHAGSYDAPTYNDPDVVRGRSISPIATNSNDESDDNSLFP